MMSRERRGKKVFSFHFKILLYSTISRLTNDLVLISHRIWRSDLIRWRIFSPLSIPKTSRVEKEPFSLRSNKLQFRCRNIPSKLLHQLCALRLNVNDLIYSMRKVNRKNSQAKAFLKDFSLIFFFSEDKMIKKIQ